MEFYGILWDFMGYLWSEKSVRKQPWDFMGFYGILWDVIGFYWILLDFMGSNFLGCYGILLDFIRFYWILWEFMVCRVDPWTS